MKIDDLTEEQQATLQSIADYMRHPSNPLDLELRYALNPNAYGIWWTTEDVEEAAGGMYDPNCFEDVLVQGVDELDGPDWDLLLDIYGDKIEDEEEEEKQ